MDRFKQLRNTDVTIARKCSREMTVTTKYNEMNQIFDNLPKTISNMEQSNNNNLHDGST